MARFIGNCKDQNLTSFAFFIQENYNGRFNVAKSINSCKYLYTISKKMQSCTIVVHKSKAQN